MSSAMYLRKSRADDPKEDVQDTLRKHREALEQFASKNRIAIIKTYEEVVTGDSLFIRPQMIQLLADVEAGLYESVVCMDIDRLGRGDMKDQGIILETFKYSGTKIATPDKIYDLNNDLDEELTEFKTFISRRELKIISKRLQRGIRQSVTEGAYVSNPPYGYDRAVVDKKATLKINDDEAYFVRMIFDMYVNQGCGCSAIADHISALGAKPRRSMAFGRGTIEKIIRNPVYIGKVSWNRAKHITKGKRGNAKHLRVPNPEEEWIIVDGLHAPIVDKELWEQANEILKGRYHPPSFNGTIKNPLAGVVVCGNCGGKMVVTVSKNKYANLRCQKKGCISGSNVVHVENSMLDILEQMLVEIELDTSQHTPADTSLLEQELKATQRNLSVAIAQKNKLFDLLEQGIYTVETFTNRSIAVDSKLSSLEDLEEMQKRQIAEAKIDRRAERIRKIKNILKVYTSSDAAQKNRMLKESIDKIVYTKAKGSGPLGFNLTVILK